MNKSDIKLIIGLIIILIICFSFMYFEDNSKNKKALVYYEDELVLTIDLNIKGEHEYRVAGYNGDILIKTSDNKIKVEEENSPNHICSKQGYIENSYEVLVCLPNKVVIKIEDNDKIDTVVK